MSQVNVNAVAAFIASCRKIAHLCDLAEFLRSTPLGTESYNRQVVGLFCLTRERIIWLALSGEAED